MPAFVRAVRASLRRPPLEATVVPGALVRDMALPLFGRVPVLDQAVGVKAVGTR